MSSRAFYDGQAYDLPVQNDPAADSRQQPGQQHTLEPRGLSPLTIKQILQAQPGDSGELTVRGNPLQQVRVVGQYAEESRCGSQAHFFLNDGSGVLHCTCALEGNHAMARLFEQLQHNKSYVEAVGKVRPGNTMFVYCARLVTDYNQLVYHSVECIHKDLKAKALSDQWQAATLQTQQPQQSTQLSNLATQAPYSSFVATYAPLAAYTDNFNAPTGLSRVALAGASYNANSLAHFAPTANATVWPPPPSTANQLRRQITDVLRATASSEHGASVRAIDAVVRGFTLIDINNELGRMADEGLIYSAKDEEHFKLCS